MAPVVTGVMNQMVCTARSHDYGNKISEITNEQQNNADQAMQYELNKSGVATDSTNSGWLC